MRIRKRTITGTVAWLAGAAAATGLCLWAVSSLGTSAGSAQGTTMDADQVRQALAAAAVGGTGTPEQTPTPTASDTSTSPGVPPSTVPTGAADSASPPTPTAPGTPEPSSPARRLTVSAGTVTARCQGSAVYLTSWSPSVGYQVQGVQRGPARQAVVAFAGSGGHVYLRVACVGGVPTAVTGDDDGSDH